MGGRRTARTKSNMKNKHKCIGSKKKVLNGLAAPGQQAAKRLSFHSATGPYTTAKRSIVSFGLNPEFV